MTVTYSETPVKEDKPILPNLENLLTPETDEENSTEGLPIKESAKRCFPYQVHLIFYRTLDLGSL